VSERAITTEHATNVHSGTGEDGVIGEILDRLPETDRWCVEFGAWDGLNLSNTRHLIESRGYAAVLIEADPAKCVELRHVHCGAGEPGNLCGRAGNGRRRGRGVAGPARAGWHG